MTGIIPTLHHSLSKISNRTIATSSSTKISATQRILSKALYKQLLRWCLSTGFEVPFGTFPPLTLTPPRVDESSLKSLVSYRANHKATVPNNDNSIRQQQPQEEQERQFYEKLNNLLPKNAILDDTKMIIPFYNAFNIHNTIRLVYLMNQNSSFSSSSSFDGGDKNIDSSNFENIVKDRIQLGFKVIKSLNELSELLDERKQMRIDNQNRDGVLFHVGQVVNHKDERYRAVITGWRRKEQDSTLSSSSSHERTSLTTKSYTTQQDVSVDNSTHSSQPLDNTTIEYDIIIDEGDSSFLRFKSINLFSSIRKVNQNELEPLNDSDLKRIQNSWSQNFFERYDSKSGTFIPGEVLRYEYPADNVDVFASINDKKEDEKNFELNSNNYAWHDTDGDSEDVIISANILSESVKSMGTILQRCIYDITSCPEYRHLPIISNINSRLDSIVQGKTKNYSDQLSSPSKEQTSFRMYKHDAIRDFGLLTQIMIEITEIMWQRRTSLECRNKFKLGSIVKHKKYGFRGIVTAWDPFPAVDVSKWDGVQHLSLEKVNSTPFYHIVADRNDTIKEFGTERPFRYVCEENLDPCPPNEQDIDVNLDDYEGWTFNSKSSENIGTKYEAPEEAKWRHAELSGDKSDITTQCMTLLQEKVFQIQLNILNSTDESNRHSELSLHHLFKLLQSVDRVEDALVLEDAIKEFWKAHQEPELRWSLNDSTAALHRGDKMKSLNILETILEKDPKYSEAWNKKATCHYLLGDMNKSLNSAEEALALNPDNFQALSGLGLVYYDTSKYQLAAKMFRKVLKLDPWSPVSPRLFACFDIMKRLGLDEE